jgi:Sigma-70, region 4
VCTIRDFDAPTSRPTVRNSNLLYWSRSVKGLTGILGSGWRDFWSTCVDPECPARHLDKSAVSSDRQRYVLVRRNVLGIDEKPATLAELSDELEISKERVRQLQREAERMLRERHYEPVFSEAA